MMDEPSAQYLTFMHPVYRGCNAVEAMMIFVMCLIIAAIFALLVKIFIGYFFISFIIFCILTQTILFKITCSKYGDYKSHKPPGVVHLKLREYGRYIGLKAKHVNRCGLWRVGS